MIWLVWAEIKCRVHAALPKRPINPFKSVQQSWYQGLRAYCPNVYTLFEGDKLGRTSVSDMIPKLSTALGLSNRISNTMVKPVTKRILEYEEDFSDSNSSANKKARHSVIKEEET